MNDEDILEYAKRFRLGMLREQPSHRMCFALSAPLQAALEALGAHSVLAQSRGHHFLLLGPNRVLDASADQFSDLHGIPAVYLGLPLQIHQHPTATKCSDWHEFMKLLSRSLPGLPAFHVGLTCRTVYAALPDCELSRKFNQTAHP